jgi:3',5'-cyclic AMP phosphodiesterase CpdA
MTARQDGTLKILVITDTHFFSVLGGILSPELNPDTLALIRDLIRESDPDLLIVTGDMWHENHNHQGFEQLSWVREQFERFDLPWAFAWGNHDKVDDVDQAHDALASAENSLYKGADSDGNYRIEVLSAESKQAVWNLFVINTGEDGMKKEQLDWFGRDVEKIEETSPEAPPAFAFFHIPFAEYEVDEQDDDARGIKLERVNCEDCEKGALSAFSASGMVKATFCGHDHINDDVVKKQGVEMVYVRATGLGGYGKRGIRKGGTLVTIDAISGEYDTQTVFPDGSTWTPDTFSLDPPE